MNRKVVPFMTALAVAVVLLIVVWQRTGTKSGVEARLESLMKCLPADLSRSQREEVRSTLKLFERSYKEGQVAPNDYREIVSALEHYISRASMTKEELQELMAWVGYYSIRMKQENLDESGRIKPPDHPLLEGKFKDRFPAP